MKAKLYDSSGKETKEISLPKNFSVKIRKDIVQKVFEAQKREQTYGTLIGAGAGYSASGISKKRRKVWKTTYGKGISRIPRKIMSRHGSSFNWVGATATNTRGGRTAHPPRIEKNQFRKINKRELAIAMNSCFSASTDANYLNEFYNTKEFKGAIVIDKKIIGAKMKDFLKFLDGALGEMSEKVLQRKTKRSGKGKMRGRKYKRSAGMLLILGEKEKMKLNGIDIVNVEDLSLENLSLNGRPGRIIVYTEDAIKEIGEKWKK